MMQYEAGELILTLSEDGKRLESLMSGERELLHPEQDALFLLRLRDEAGNAHLFSAEDAVVTEEGEAIRYQFDDFSVLLHIEGGDKLVWRFLIDGKPGYAAEFLDLVNVKFGGALRNDGGDCAVISGYNEGMIVEDWRLKTDMIDPEYPSKGAYMMYPYMVSAPLTMYLYGDRGLAMYVTDAESGPKGLDFKCQKDNVQFRTRIFLGGEPGKDVDKDISVVWAEFEGDWQDGADIYREHVYETIQALPLDKLELPDWYLNDMPLVLTYPVRGIHDMDEMTPNKLFPYCNALPYVDEFAKRTNSKILVLLMHWEGTAPWAPPYVWPPYGGAEGFNEFMRKLHADGHLLGVYCSGLGLTKQSNLIAECNNEERIEKEELWRGFCLAPDQSIRLSDICTAQRSGYDLCPQSETGRMILDEALQPLLTSGVDYVQALDQNHGGGMYFCYAKEHGHPPVPGGWMTTASRDLLDGWKKMCPNTLLGCESAAAEAYISALRLSDNRYELCYNHGKPIPLYAYLYHKYLHNFMGNQVSAPIAYTTEGLCARIAYSFAAGDLITLVLNDDGEVMFHWGMRDFSKTPDRDTIMDFCAALHLWHKKYPALFRDAEMVKPEPYTCDEVDLPLRDGDKRTEKAVLSTAWALEEKTVQLFVNYTDVPRSVRLTCEGSVIYANGELQRADFFTVPPLSAVAIEY